MKYFIGTAIISVLLTAFTMIIPLFIVGIEYMFLPVMIVLLTIGAIGVITIPVSLYRYFYRKKINKKLLYLNGCALGCYIAYLLTNPVYEWDEKQREISGQVLSHELNVYKAKYGNYPESLAQLNIIELNKKLPQTYQVNRFFYQVQNEAYHLDIPIPITDRWHWNIPEKRWEYQ